MADRTQFHVVPRGDRWEVESAGKSVSSHHWQQAAIDDARERARQAVPAQLLIHGQDGRIEREATYGDDPSPPRG